MYLCEMEQNNQTDEHRIPVESSSLVDSNDPVLIRDEAHGPEKGPKLCPMGTVLVDICGEEQGDLARPSTTSYAGVYATTKCILRARITDEPLDSGVPV